MEITKIPKQTPEKPKVGVYVRVSTKKEEQEYSFTFQSQYWNKRFGNDESVEYVGLFTDEGISGKKMKNRKGLLALLEKAKKGEIDKIYTKSISRFARNYTEIIAVIRELREKGIPIIFEKENINTLDPKCNLILSVMSSLAEEELRSMSKNQKWAIRKRFADGKMQLNRIYGYDYNHGQLTVNPETAKIVKRIFELFLNGMGAEKIAKSLENEGYITMHGSKEWSRVTILKVLRNEKYIGDSLLQKNFIGENGKTKNRGELPQYYVENTHEPLISREDFEKVQRILEERYSKYHLDANHKNLYPLSGKIVCGICGAKFIRKTCAKGTTYETVKWSCRLKDRRGKAECPSNDIKDEVIKKLLIEAYNECIDAKLGCSDAVVEENKLKTLLAAEREMRELYAKGYLSDNRFKSESDRLLIKIREQEQLIQKIKSQNINIDKFKKSAYLTQEIADFLVSAKVIDWTVTFEFANGYITTKPYTNGRAGNVNGKLCKHKT